MEPVTKRLMKAIEEAQRRVNEARDSWMLDRRKLAESMAENPHYSLIWVNHRLDEIQNDECQLHERMGYLKALEDVVALIDQMSG